MTELLPAPNQEPPLINPLELEDDLRRTAERHFVETLSTIAGHSESVVMETGERGEDSDPFTDLFLVLREGTHTPESLRDMKVDIGLDSELSAHITTDGSGILVNTPVSDGRLAKIFDANKAVVDPKLVSALEKVREQSLQRAIQINLDSARALRDEIAASLGRTYTG
jgi:hypothetical protein